jgi:hypothetical protein
MKHPVKWNEGDLKWRISDGASLRNTSIDVFVITVKLVGMTSRNFWMLLRRS